MTQESLSKLMPKAGFSVQLISKPLTVEGYRELYYGVGKPWNWLDRMVMDDEELNKKINADDVDVYKAKFNDMTCGFAEFGVQSTHVEILYFGLYPNFIGMGLGKYFLKWVVNHAWSYGLPKIQLNTCELDHPNALPVYKSAGFNEIRTAYEQRRILMPF